MRKLLFILCIFGILTSTVDAQLLKYDGSIPKNNETITSFSVDLYFNLDEVISSYGEGEYGVGYWGEYDDFFPEWSYYTALYEGSGYSKVLLGISLANNFVGNDPTFHSGNVVHIEFPEFIPVPNKEYTLEVSNCFQVYSVGSSKALQNTNLDFQTSPLTLSFIGGANTTDNLSLESCSLLNGSVISSLGEVEYIFNHEIDYNEILNARLREDDSVVAESSSAKIGDSKKSLILDFGDVPLYFGHTYTLELPENIVNKKDDVSVCNSSFIINLKGDRYHLIPVNSSYPIGDEVGLPTYASATFDLPENMVFKKPSGVSYNVNAVCYRESISEDNIVGELSGNVSENGKTIVWNIDSPLIPETKYYIYVPSGQFYAYSSSYAYDWVNDEVLISFTTPSVEDQGLAEMAFGELLLCNTTSPSAISYTTEPFTEGMSLENCNSLLISLEGHFYSLDGENYDLKKSADVNVGYLYEIDATGKESLVKELQLTAKKLETSRYYYTAAMVIVGADLYEGRSYRVVVPEGAYTISYPTLQNYVRSPEISFTIKGAAEPLQFKVTNCSVEDESISEIVPVVAWTFNHPYVLTDSEAKATVEVRTSGISTYGRYTFPIMTEKTNNATYACISPCAVYTGKFLELKAGQTATIIIPAGTFAYSADKSICNDELRLTIYGKDPDSGTPEFVNTTVTLADNESNESHSFVVKTAKGYPAEIQLLPGESWNVADVAHEGKSLSAVNGVYSSEPLNEDSKIVATLAYVKEMIFEQSTGVYSVEYTDIKVFTENNQIVVSGLTEPTDIAVYTVGGILIKSMRTDAAYDMVRISADANEAYVVVINGQAAKVKL